MNNIVGQALKAYAIDNQVRCPYCGVVFNSNNISIDHCKPKSKGGKNSTDNYIVCCKTCNSCFKQDKDFYVFLIEDSTRLVRFQEYLLQMSGYYYYCKCERKIVNYCSKLRANFTQLNKLLNKATKDLLANEELKANSLIKLQMEIFYKNN